MKCKVMLRRTGHTEYHYALTKRFLSIPEPGETISVRDLDGTTVQAIVHAIAREQHRESGRVVRIHINASEAKT
jgi:hypothetical protein